MASLVRGVGVLERDRQQKNAGSTAQAPAWWKHFHFELHELLMEDGIISGAIFEFKSRKTEDYPDEAPKFVISLCSTMLTMATFLPDLEQDYGILINNLHRSSRFRRVLSCAEKKVESAGVRTV